MEECERLAQVGETWQKKYYELNPPRQPVRLDFNLPNENQQDRDVERMKWVKVEDRLPEIEGYYKVKYDDGTEDEKPFRIRPRNNIHGFMTMNIVTHWMDSTQNTQADEDVRDYEASDKPVIEHPCDAPLKDGATIEQRFQKQYEKCMLSLSDIIEEVQSLYELYKGVPKQ
jgi:hypothetical protein